MTPPDDMLGSGRRRQRALVGVMIIVATVGVLVAVGLSALRLGGITTDLTSIRTSSDTVASSTREALLLEQMVTALGETTDGRAVAVQAGLLQRQLIVSIAAFPPDAAPARELRAVQQVLAAFPWEELPVTGGHDDPRRLAALDLVMGAERRINAVRVEQEKQFYLATTAALEGSRRSQLGLSALVGLVLALGVVGVTVVTRRSRSRIATAYDALKGEVGERRAAEDALRASEGRFRSLVQRASDLTVVTDAAGIVHYVSPAAETLLGHRPEDLLAPPPARARRAGPARGRRAGHRVPRRAARPRAHDRAAAVHARRAGPLGGGGLPEPVGRRRRGRARLERARRHRTAGAGGRAHAPGPPRPADRPGQPRAAARPAARGPGGARHGVGDPGRPRRLQERERHARPPGGRRAAALGRAAPARVRATRGHDGRLGGDEFAVVTHGGPELAQSVGRRIVETLRRPFGVAGHEVRIGASVGVASPATAANRPKTCCATPTSPCTRRRTRARAGSRCSSPPCACGRRSARACSRSWPARWSRAASRCTSSRSSTCAPPARRAWRRSRAGGARTARSCPPTCSCRSPRRPARSRRSGGSCCARPAAPCSTGARPCPATATSASR